MTVIEPDAPAAAQAWRRVLHDASLRPGNIKAWLRMGWPKHPLPGDEAALAHRMAGLDRKHPGEAAAVVRYLEQAQLIEAVSNGHHRITASGCARAQ